MTDAERREKIDEEFMKLGVQYYVAARSTAWAALLPVCGNLYHHALEMFLKAGLSRKYSLEQLKYEFGHKLIDVWKAFKADFPSTALLQFETTIADIAEFEEIRYPDNVLEHGAQMLVDWGPIPAQISASSPPLYKLYPMNLDRLIGEIFSASCRNQLFFTTRLKPDVQDMLARDNPVAAQLLGN
jgi:hypothetical protein